MEHRCSERKEVLLDVVVRNRQGLTLQGQAQNLSSEGMYIEVVSPDIRKGGMLDIELPDECCLRGWVAHTGDNGIGVLFVLLSSAEMVRPISPWRKEKRREEAEHNSGIMI